MLSLGDRFGVDHYMFMFLNNNAYEFIDYVLDMKFLSPESILQYALWNGRANIIKYVSKKITKKVLNDVEYKMYIASKISAWALHIATKKPITCKLIKSYRHLDWTINKIQNIWMKWALIPIIQQQDERMLKYIVKTIGIGVVKEIFTRKMYEINITATEENYGFLKYMIRIIYPPHAEIVCNHIKDLYRCPSHVKTMIKHGIDSTKLTGLLQYKVENVLFKKTLEKIIHPHLVGDILRY